MLTLPEMFLAFVRKFRTRFSRVVDRVSGLYL